jgi:ribulose-5-phosphate 4-epimerase/fuculose-1-phosphate aldolase
MLTPGEGYIKFVNKWDKTGPIISDSDLEKLNAWREILFNLGMVGADSEGIGFGNLSIRKSGTGHFYITGSATGSLKDLGPDHYCLVTGFNLDENTLACTGPIKASSESMSHAAIYSEFPGAGAVIHVHHNMFWKNLVNRIPTTAKDVEYGTPEMAREIIRLLNEPGTLEGRIIIMGGHRDGIIVFGKDMDDAGRYLLSYYNTII